MRLRAAADALRSWDRLTQGISPLDAKTVGEWFTKLHEFKDLLSEARRLPDPSGTGRAAREYKCEIVDALERAQDAAANFVSFVTSFTPSPHDARSNAEFIEERRSFQRKLRTALREVHDGWLRVIDA